MCRWVNKFVERCESVLRIKISHAGRAKSQVATRVTQRYVDSAIRLCQCVVYLCVCVCLCNRHFAACHCIGAHAHAYACKAHLIRRQAHPLFTLSCPCPCHSPTERPHDAWATWRHHYSLIIIFIFILLKHLSTHTHRDSHACLTLCLCVCEGDRKREWEVRVLRKEKLFLANFWCLLIYIVHQHCIRLLQVGIIKYWYIDDPQRAAKVIEYRFNK